MAVEDVGRIINPLTLHGQTVGAIVQGLGGALLEHLAYDADGQFLAGTLADYLLPTASDFPVIRAHALEEKPAPHNPLGAKGAGEGGIIPVGGVIANAVANALGVEPNVLPLSPPRVWELIQSRQAMTRRRARRGMVPVMNDAMTAAATARRAKRRNPDRARPLARSRIAPALQADHRRAPAAERNHRRLPAPRTDALPAARDVRRLRLGLSRVLENAPHPGAGLRLVGLGRCRAWRAQLGGRQLFRSRRSTTSGTTIRYAVASASVAPNGIGRAGGRRPSAERPLGLRQRLRSRAMDSARLDGEGRRRAGIADVPGADRARSRSSTTGMCMGLCGTGSKSIAVKDVVVPATHSVSMHELKTGTAPGAAVHRRQSALPHAAQPAGAVLAELGHRRSCRAGGRRIRRIHPRAPLARSARRRSGSRAIDGGRGCGTGRDGGARRRAHHRPQHSAGRGAPGDHRRAGRLVAAQCVLFDAACAFRRQADLRGGRRHRAVCRAIRCRKSSATSTAASAHLSLTWHRAAPPTGRSASACRSISIRSDGRATT